MLCGPRLPLPPGVFASAGSLAIAGPTRPSPGGPPVYATILAYASLTGGGSLGGVSGYRPDGDASAAFDPAAPWNTGPARKWTRRALSGSYQIFPYTLPDGAGDRICYSPPSPPYGLAASEWHVFSGSAVFDFTGAVSASALQQSFDYSGAPGACVLGAPIPYAVSTLPYPGGFTVQQSLTTSRIFAGPVVNTTAPYSPQASIVYLGSASASLSSPDTEYAALARGAPVPGVLDRTAGRGVFAATSPGSDAPLAFTDCDAVRASLRFEGLAAGGVYIVDAMLERTPIAGGAAESVADFGRVLFFANAPAQTVGFDLPVYPGYYARLIWARAHT